MPKTKREYTNLPAEDFWYNHSREERLNHKLHWGGHTWVISNITWDLYQKQLAMSLTGRKSHSTDVVPHTAYVVFHGDYALQVSREVPAEPPWKSRLRVGDLLTDPNGGLYIVFTVTGKFYRNGKGHMNDVGLIKVVSPTGQKVRTSQVGYSAFSFFEENHGPLETIPGSSSNSPLGVRYFQDLVGDH